MPQLSCGQASQHSSIESFLKHMAITSPSSCYFTVCMLCEGHCAATALSKQPSARFRSCAQLSSTETPSLFSGLAPPSDSASSSAPPPRREVRQAAIRLETRVGTHRIRQAAHSLAHRRQKVVLSHVLRFLIAASWILFSTYTWLGRCCKVCIRRCSHLTAT